MSIVVPIFLDENDQEIGLIEGDVVRYDKYGFYSITRKGIPLPCRLPDGTQTWAWQVSSEVGLLHPIRAAAEKFGLGFERIEEDEDGRRQWELV